jgi:hypothetical protein
MPVTVPPLKATDIADGRPLRAASAVRTLARTATFMPMNPAAADSAAPITKPTDTFQPPRSGIRSTSATTTATTATVVYWRRRYAAAPSWIAAAIARISSLPCGFASTQRIRARP